MRVAVLELTNYRSFAGSEPIELDQINVLVGRNNGGKSTIIRALYLLQTGSIFNPGDVRIGSDEAVIRYAMKEIDRPHLRQYIPQGLPNEGILEFHQARDGGLTLTGQYGSNRVGFGQFPKREPENFIFPYLSKRKVTEFSQTVNLDTTLSVGHNMEYLVSKISRFSNPAHPNYEEYRSVCRKVLGLDITAFASPSGHQAGIIVDRVNNIPLEAMGEGVSSLLGLITDLCGAEGYLFLLEEPENDVHPEALKTILEFIIDKSNSNQFVISTHSNVVTKYLGSAPNSRVYRVSLDTTARPPASAITPVITPVDRIEVLRELGYSPFDLELWDGWLILEESSAERLVRQYFVPWFTPGLGRVRTIAAGGNSKVEPVFDDFYRLFCFAHLEVQYRNRAWVVVDGDATGHEIVRNLQSRFPTWNRDNFKTLSKEDFEEYYPDVFADDVRKVLSITDRQTRRRAKRELLDTVLAWIEEDVGRARQEFEGSAEEVIEVLRDIDKSLP